MVWGWTNFKIFKLKLLIFIMSFFVIFFCIFMIILILMEFIRPNPIEYKSSVLENYAHIYDQKSFSKNVPNFLFHYLKLKTIAYYMKVLKILKYSKLLFRIDHYHINILWHNTGILYIVPTLDILQQSNTHSKQTIMYINMNIQFYWLVEIFLLFRHKTFFFL